MLGRRRNCAVMLFIIKHHKGKPMKKGKKKKKYVYLTKKQIRHLFLHFLPTDIESLYPFFIDTIIPLKKKKKKKTIFHFVTLSRQKK